MGKVKSRNLYRDTTFYLIENKNGKLKLTEFYRVGQKQNGIDFINATKNVDTDNFVLIGTHLDSEYDIDPCIITDLNEQRLRVYEYIKNYASFNEESVNL